MKRVALLGLAIVFPLAFAGIAQASTTVHWTGGVDQGSNNLPCDDGAHWILSPAQGITSATLTFKGHTYTMDQNGDGSFTVDTPGPVVVGDTASATYEGDNDNAFLKLSHCTSSSPSPTSSSTSTSTSTSSSSSSSSSSTSSTSSSSSSSGQSSTQETHVKGVSHTKSGGGGNKNGTGGTAFTGSNTTPYTAVAALLMLLGLTSLYVARRRSARTES